MQGIEMFEQLLHMEICCVLCLLCDGEIEDLLPEGLELADLVGLDFEGSQQCVTVDLVLEADGIELGVQPGLGEQVTRVEVPLHLHAPIYNLWQPQLQSYTDSYMRLIIRLVLLIAAANAKLVWLGDVANPGARYPINDVYDGNQVPKMQGQLNSIGIRQQYLLGSYLRADYVEREELIGRVYNPRAVEVFAISDVDRSYDSALARLYGLFPAGTGWRIPDQVTKDKLEPPFQSNFTQRHFRSHSDQMPFGLDLGFQPVPIYPLDEILNDACPNAGVIKTKRLQQIAKNLTTFQGQHSALLSKLKLVFNLSSLQMTIPGMSDLYDTIISDITLGKTLPKSFDDYDLKSLKYISDYYNTYLWESTSYAQTFSTLILSAIKSKMQQVRLHTIGDKKWSMFFTKEGTLAPLMTLLNLTSSECLTQRWKNQTVTAINCMEPPTFSSNLLMEMHEDDSFQHQVRIKYNGQYVGLCGKTDTSCEYRNFWGRLNINSTAYNSTCYGKA